MKLVIDKNILIKGFEGAEPVCMSALYSFNENYQLQLVFDLHDTNGNSVVEQEYFQNLGNNRFFQKWYKDLSRQIHYTDGKLDKKIKDELYRRGFHEITDQTFVALALKTDKCLITEDSDYGKGHEVKSTSLEKQEVLRYLTEILGLNIMDSGEGIVFLREIS